MQEIIFKQEAYDIIGACMEVHKELGAGFLEAVYQEALAREFTTRGIPFEREKQLLIMFKGKPLEKMYAADFICWNKIIVELKSTRDLLPQHEAQLFNYLKATSMTLGLLVNFAKPSLDYKRIVFTKKLAQLA